MIRLVVLIVALGGLMGCSPETTPTECGGIAGLKCPEGFQCITPRGTADAMGQCEKG